MEFFQNMTSQLPYLDGKNLSKNLYLPIYNSIDVVNFVKKNHIFMIYFCLTSSFIIEKSIMIHKTQISVDGGNFSKYNFTIAI